MSLRHALVLLGLIAGGSGAAAARAQQADVIRGRVVSEDGQPIENATVQATSIPNNVNKNTRTDKSGRFTIAFPGGDGDYWVNISAIGFAPRRFELKRIADEDILVGDAKLTRAGVTLDAVKVRAERAKPARNDNAADVGGTEKTVGVAAVDPAQAGNLAAMAAALPGVQLVPGADGNPDQFSVFGLGGDQNATALNGLGYGGGEIPRDAATKSSLGTSPWDVSRGGFSGGQFALRTQSGSNFSSRGTSSLLNAPPLQWTDRAGRSTGAEYTSLSLGASTAGPVALDRVFYSAGYQLDRRSSALPTLTTANELALATAGVAVDSVSRLRGLLGQAGVPLTAPGLPSARTIDRGSALAAFDFSPPSSTSGQSLNVTVSGTFNRANAPFSQITTLSTTDAERTSWFGSLQARHTNYFGFGVLTETSVGIARSRDYTSPYLAIPNATVRVRSTLDDGSAAITQLAFGGSPVQNTSNATTTLGAQNQLSWFSTDNKHRIRLTSELRREAYDQDVAMYRLGLFSYNSLDELGAGRPSSFSRLLGSRVRGGNEVVGAISLGDSYRPRADLQIQFGVRVDGNVFASRPIANSAVERAFGVSNDAVPSRLYVSPRAGFAWTYGQAAQLPIGNGFVRGPRAVVRGGIGWFQNTPRAALIGPALVNTGLPDAVQQITCVGAAAPAPNWSAYLSDPRAIPERCADGSAGTVFSSATPNVTLFDKSYAAQRSLRSNLNWSGGILGSRLVAALDATSSLNLAQAGFVDLNFNPTARFALTDEGARPVYVRPASIVPGTGAVAVPDARRAAGFARVVQLRSDLQSVSRQMIVAIRPVAFSTRYGWELSYVYSNTRELASGFTSTAGNPNAKEWSRSPFDSRHQVVYGLSYNFFDWVPVSLSGSIRSGRPFTPLVGGDVNGDGYSNDRAFVFNPDQTTDPSVAAGFRALLDGGSAAARDCLARQLGRLAARNSCQAPWTSTSNLSVSVNPLRVRLPQRVNVSLYVNNAFGAADLLLHGERRRRGWGQTADPDQSLLFVRGFDAATQKFRYEVNPRFGATALGQTLNRNPVVVTAIARVDVGFTRERQLLTQSLDRGRGRPGTRSTDQDIKGMTGILIPANPMALILQQTDSLLLTRRQADSLSMLNRAYTLRFDAIWTPVARFLADLPAGYDRRAAYDRYRRAREASVDLLIALAPQVRGLLTAAQLRMLPALATSSLDTRYLASVRSSTAGGANMGVLAMLAQLGGMGSSADAQTVMIHR